MKYSQVYSWPNESTRERSARNLFEALVSHLHELKFAYPSTVTFCRSAGNPCVHVLVDSPQPYDDGLEFYNGIEGLQAKYKCRAQTMESIRLPTHANSSTIREVLKRLPGIEVIGEPVLVPPAKESSSDTARKQAALDAYIASEAASILRGLPSYGAVELASEVTATTEMYFFSRCGNCRRTLAILRSSAGLVREADPQRYRLQSPVRCACGDATAVLIFREGGP